jgi:hypothetical protein
MLSTAPRYTAATSLVVTLQLSEIDDIGWQPGYE